MPLASRLADGPAAFGIFRAWSDEQAIRDLDTAHPVDYMTGLPGGGHRISGEQGGWRLAAKAAKSLNNKASARSSIG